MSETKETKYTYFLVSYSWQYGKESGNGAFTRGFTGYNGKIGEETIKGLKDIALEINKDTFARMKGSSFIFFITSISNLGEMTEDEFKVE